MNKTKNRSSTWTQVVISKKSRDLLRMISERIDLPMAVVLESMIYKRAVALKIVEEEPSESTPNV